jgi:signal transduction histidine kinase/ABC-type nitrate/sulfonate/bicarbonate transport system substrate-binding protein
MAFDNSKKVTLQLQWKNQFQFAGYYVALEKGFYKDLGLDVKIKSYKKGLNITNEVLQGKSNFGIGRSTLLIDKSNNKDIILLNAIFQTSPLVLFSLKDNNINTITDFMDQKIMINKNQTVTIAIKAMLNSKNITFDDMQLYKRTYNIEDLISKKIDLMPGYLSDIGYKLENKKINYKIFDPKDYGFDFYEDILFTSTQYAKDNPQIVKNFQKATLKGWEYAFSNMDETTELILKKYNTQNKTKSAYLYEANILKKRAYYQNKPLGDIDFNKIKRIYSSYNLLGFINNYNPSLQGLIFNKQSSYLNLTQEEKNYIKEKENIKICIDPNWLPFEKIDNNSNHIGISSDYFNYFSKQLNIPFQLIKTNSWTQTLEFAKNRKCDLITLANETPSRKKYLNFTNPYIKIPFVLVTKNEVQFLDNLHFLENKKIGVVKNSALNEILKEKYPNFKLVNVNNNLDGITRVQQNEIFGYVGNMLSIGHMIQTNFIKDVKIINKLENETSNLAIGVRNDDIHLLNIMNHLVKNIPFSLHKQIENKYIGVKYEQQVSFKYLNELIISIVFIIIIFLLLQYKQKQLNINLEKKVQEKTKELEYINKNLEQRIKDEVNKNSQKEQIIAQQAKMVAMGEMLENIAHQWRQPLSIISTSATAMLMQKELNISNKEAEINSYETINNTAQHLSKTIDDFRNFFKSNKKMQRYNLKTILTNTLNMIENSFKSEGVLIYNQLNDIHLECLDSELTQVFLNLLNNAKDAYENTNIEEKYIFIEMYKENTHAIVKFHDNAGGIEKDFIDKIFEPYFTTKHQSQGTGIGLYMSQEIISRHLGGTIQAKNVSFEHNNQSFTGAQFTITLPIQ